MRRLRSTRAIIAATVAVVMAMPTTAFAYVVPTFDAGNFAGIVQQINSVRQQIAKMSELVGAARDQIDTLNKVSAGIRDLKSVVDGGVQGILGSAADSLGLKDVFAVGKELQATVTDGISLYRDARKLPDDAKRALKEVGLAVNDIEEYLADGVVYEAFHGMGIDQWKEVFEDPVQAFATGAVGSAIVRSESYLDTDAMRKEYANRLAEMTPEERAKLSGVAGVDMALLNFGSWGKGMKKRLVDVVNFSVVADKLIDKAGPKKTILEAQNVGTAATLNDTKLRAELGIQQNEADSATAGLLAGQTGIMKSEREREAINDTMDVLTDVPIP